MKNIHIFAIPFGLRGNSSVGRARPCQGRGREFESRFPLKNKSSSFAGLFFAETLPPSRFATSPKGEQPEPASQNPGGSVARILRTHRTLRHGADAPYERPRSRDPVAAPECSGHFRTTVWMWGRVVHTAATIPPRKAVFRRQYEKMRRRFISWSDGSPGACVADRASPVGWFVVCVCRGQSVAGWLAARAVPNAFEAWA